MHAARGVRCRLAAVRVTSCALQEVLPNADIKDESSLHSLEFIEAGIKTAEAEFDKVNAGLVAIYQRLQEMRAAAEQALKEKESELVRLETDFNRVKADETKPKTDRLKALAQRRKQVESDIAAQSTELNAVGAHLAANV